MCDHMDHVTMLATIIPAHAMSLSTQIRVITKCLPYDLCLSDPSLLPCSVPLADPTLLEKDLDKTKELMVHYAGALQVRVSAWGWVRNRIKLQETLMSFRSLTAATAALRMTCHGSAHGVGSARTRS